MALEDRISEAIRENLPEQTAKELKKRLEELSRVEKENESLKEQTESLSRTIAEQEKELDDMRAELIPQQEVKRTERMLEEAKIALEKRERNLEMEVMRNTIGMLENRNQAIQSLVERVFGNPRIVHSRHSSTYGQRRDQYGHDNFVELRRDDETTETEERTE